MFLDMQTYQTAVARSSWFEFLKAPMIGSPNKKLARITPENIETIHDTQQASGCFLENGKLPIR